MRNLSFLAYIHHLNRLVEVVSINFKEKKMDVEFSGNINTFRTDDGTLFPSIGKKDIEGNEIYEGHIVSIEAETSEGFYRTDYFEVIWYEDTLSYVLKRDSIIHHNVNLFEICKISHHSCDTEKIISTEIQASGTYIRPGFKITCLNCGSTDCESFEDIDYDYEENPYSWGEYLVCNKCGNSSR